MKRKDLPKNIMIFGDITFKNHNRGQGRAKNKAIILEVKGVVKLKTLRQSVRIKRAVDPFFDCIIPSRYIGDIEGLEKYQEFKDSL